LNNQIFQNKDFCIEIVVSLVIGFDILIKPSPFLIALKVTRTVKFDDFVSVVIAKEAPVPLLSYFTPYVILHSIDICYV